MARLRKPDTSADSGANVSQDAVAATNVPPVRQVRGHGSDVDGRWRTRQSGPSDMAKIGKDKPHEDDGSGLKRMGSVSGTLMTVQGDDDHRETVTREKSEDESESEAGFPDVRQLSEKLKRIEDSPLVDVSATSSRNGSPVPEPHAHLGSNTGEPSDSEASGDSSSETSGDDSDLSDFIVDDSASEEELRRGARRIRQTPPLTRSPRRLIRRSPAKRSPLPDMDSEEEIRVQKPSTRANKVAKPSDSEEQLVKDGGGEASGKEHIPIENKNKTKSRKASIAALADQLDATLRLSPPRATNVSDSAGEQGNSPSESPSRRLLKSPTRNRIIIPTSPHRQSVDAFWSQETVNEWNDEHSPRKKVDLQNRLRHFHISPGRGQISKPMILDSDLDEFQSSESEDEGLHTPTENFPKKTPRRRSFTRRTESPEKIPSKTPASPSKARDPERRTFLETGRQQLALTFLDQLLDTIRISVKDDRPARALFEACGGAKIRWSKTLQKTAGRARVRVRHEVGRLSVKEAEIELAEKVLWTAEQVYNTLAHEFCHLLTMATYPKASAHGKEFYHFANEIERRIPKPAPGVSLKITTKHSYEIQFKYVWQCEACGREIGRHSKSIPDHATHKICGGRFLQIKPAPRKGPGANGGGISGSPTKTAWQTFQQENYKAVQQQLMSVEGKQPVLKDVMSKLSEMWKEQKLVQTGSKDVLPLGASLGSQENTIDAVRGDDRQSVKAIEISDGDDSN